MNPSPIRQTNHFTASLSKRGVRLAAKERNATPKSRVVPQKDWDQYLSILSDASFNAACVADYGIGVFAR